MRKFTITFATMILAFAAQADCVFQSFVIGEQFSIGNMLEWSTIEEIDNQLFIIEKSIDGKAYQEAGQVETLGDSEEPQTYRFMDLDASKGRTHYRIKQVDLDGDFSYSHTVAIDKESNNEFMIATINGSNGNETVELAVDAMKDMEITYSVKDMTGDVLEEVQTQIIAGLNDISFDLSSYPNGSYKLFLEAGDEVETLTIRKTNSTAVQAPVASKN